MKAIFVQELKRTRASLVIWSVFIGMLAAFGMLEYPIIGQYADLMAETLRLIPKAAQLVFGVYNVDLTDPIGYYVVMYYWTGLLVFLHAIYTGASIIAKESRDKTAEFLFTKPHRRGAVVGAKILVGFANIFIVFAVATVCSMASMLPVTQEPGAYGQMAAAGAGMLFTQCVLMSLGVLCSALFPTYKAGVRAAVGVLIACYLFMFCVQYVGLPQLNFLSPLTFFAVAEVVRYGLSWPYVLLAVAVTALCLGLSQRIYRDKQMLS